MTSNKYAPLPLRLHVNKILFGQRRDDKAEDDDLEPPGLWNQRHQAMERAIEATRSLAEWRGRSCCCRCAPDDEDDLVLAHYKNEKQNNLSEAKRFAEQIEALERLANPALMGEAYALLEEEFDDPRCWPAFIDAARTIQKDFSIYRSLSKEADALIRRISVVAQELANLVRDFRSTGVRLPDLLKPRWGEEGSDSVCIWGSPELRELQIKQFVDTFFEQRKEKGSEVRPDIRRLLVRLSDECQNYRADFMDKAIDSALSTRQQSQKSSLLRAFAASLQANKIYLSPTVKRAMAIAANVVLNDPEQGISDDHVRKAIGTMRPARRPIEKRRPKLPRKTRGSKTL